MQKPTLRIWTHTHIPIRVCAGAKYTHEHLLQPCFRRLYWNFLGFWKSKTSVSKRQSICLLPHPDLSMQTPQREFAVQIYNFFLKAPKEKCHLCGFYINRRGDGLFFATLFLAARARLRLAHLSVVSRSSVGRIHKGHIDKTTIVYLPLASTGIRKRDGY